MTHYRSVAIFAVLCFVLLGLVPLYGFLIGADGGLAAAATRAEAETGLMWTSSLLVVGRMVIAEPVLMGLLIGSVVPLLAAMAGVFFSPGKGRFREFFGRLHPFRDTAAREALVSYGLIFAVLVPALFAVLLLRQYTGGEYQSAAQSLSFSLVAMVVGMAFLDQGAVLEEMGWRGFATAELQRTTLAPLKVALAIGVFWGLWHLPRDITTGVVDRLGLFEYALFFLPSFLLGTISISVIASYFMNRLGGSVIPAIMVHSIANDAVGLSGTASIVEALTPYHQLTKNVFFGLIAISIVVLAGKSLGQAEPP